MPDQVNLLSIILDALGAFEGTITRGDRDWVSYPSDGDPEDILHQYLDDIERAKTVIAALMPGPRLTPKLRREIRKVLTEIERSADNPDSVKLSADTTERLDRFKQDHPDLVSTAVFVTDVEDWFEHELDPFIRKHLPDPNTRPEGRMEQLRQIVGDDKEADLVDKTGRTVQVELTIVLSDDDEREFHESLAVHGWANKLDLGLDSTVTARFLPTSTAQHGLLVPDPIVVRGSDQDKAQWRCRYSDELTMIGHHGTVADLEAAVRKEIRLYQLAIDPDAVDYAALARYIIRERL